jgi:hypothetical protein
MNLRTFRQSAILFLTLGLAGGCSATQPIKSWQQRLTTYTMRHGGGDLSILRESPELRSTDDVRPAQVRFDHTNTARAGLPPFVDRLDVHGVLVGQQVQGGNPKFFFLVGVVERPLSSNDSQLKEIRLVSCTIRDGRHHWKTSRPDPEAQAAYRRGARNPRRAQPEAGGRVFPLLDDHFDFNLAGRTAIVRDPRSDASWELPLD